MAKSRADKMTIVEHLVEFRKRLIAVVLCYIIVFIVAFVFGGELYQVLTASLHQNCWYWGQMISSGSMYRWPISQPLV